MARAASVCGLLARATHGLAAVEFALVGSLMVVLLIGLYDLTSAYILWRRLTQAAQTISEIATKIAVQPDGTNMLNYSQLVTVSSAIYPIVPGTNSASPASYGVAMTAVTFTATPGCTTNCAYTGSPRWSAAPQGTQPIRPCGNLGQGSDGPGSSPTTLPSQAFQASSLLVVDVSATYAPLFLSFITGPIKLVRSAYLPPRSGTVTDYVKMDFTLLPPPTGAVTSCPPL